MDLLGGGIAGGGNEETLERERERQRESERRTRGGPSAIKMTGEIVLDSCIC